MYLNKNVIIRSKSAGVFAGVLVKRFKNQHVRLEHARRIYYWEGASTLSELAEKGVSRPGTCKFPMEVPLIDIFEVIEIIPLTDQAKKTIDSVLIWTQH